LGQPALVQAELAIGLALARKARLLTINNTCGGVFLLPMLQTWLQQQGCQASVYLTLANGQALRIDIGSTGVGYNCFYPALGKDQDHADNVIRVIFGSPPAVAGDLYFGSSDLQACRQHYLSHGIGLDRQLWQQLCKASVLALVPESADSCLGAGPSGS
jgi:DNA polymerase III psi subunit